MLSSLPPILLGLLPELVLVTGASLLLIVGLSPSKNRGATCWALTLLTLVGAVLATWYVSANPPERDPSISADSLVWFTRIVVLAVGLLILMVNRHVPEDGEQGEFMALALFSLAGVLLVAIANDLILLFLALELVSVPTYILIGLSRRDARAQESTVKYFFLGALAAALTLYGFSFLYAAAGTMRLFSEDIGGPSIATTLSQVGMGHHDLTILGVMLTLAGLAFKIAAVPLHFYVADVYQGAAAPVTGMLGFVPKFAGFLALTRLLSLGGWAMGDAVFWVLWLLAALTMTVGNTLALWQNNVKRMLAYSSIAHSGYMLVGFAAGPGPGDATSPMRNGLTAVFFYMVVYGVMNLGAFAALSFFRKDGDEGEDSAETLDDLSGCARRHPWAALAMAVCVLSLMGLPPTGGFLGKLYLFSAALSASDGSPHEQAMIALVIIGVINSAIAAAFYLKIVACMYLRPATVAIRPSRCATLAASLAVCVALVLASFVWPDKLFDKARQGMTDASRQQAGLIRFAANPPAP